MVLPNRKRSLAKGLRTWRCSGTTNTTLGFHNKNTSLGLEKASWFRLKSIFSQSSRHFNFLFHFVPSMLFFCVLSICQTQKQLLGLYNYPNHLTQLFTDLKRFAFIKPLKHNDVELNWTEKQHTQNSFIAVLYIFNTTSASLENNSPKPPTLWITLPSLSLSTNFYPLLTHHPFWPRKARKEYLSCEITLYCLAPICYWNWIVYWSWLLSSLHHVIATTNTCTHPFPGFFPPIICCSSFSRTTV